MATVSCELPLEIIQHIQSFLDWKDAACTTSFSKQWYVAWSTRPNLELNDLHFKEIRRGGFWHDFQDFARKTLNRYRKLNLKLECLRFRMLMIRDDEKSPELANELISEALHLGIKELDLKVFFISYKVPQKVFESTSLTSLALGIGCRIVEVPCSRVISSPIVSPIVSLELNEVRVNDSAMRDVLVRCPLIQKLSLIDCYDLKRVQLSSVRRTLKHFSARASRGEYIDRLQVRFEEFEYSNLASLELHKVKFDNDLFSSNFWYKFPCLEKLALGDSKVSDNYSYTIKCLRFHVPYIGNRSLSSGTGFSESDWNYSIDLIVFRPNDVSASFSRRRNIVNDFSDSFSRIRNILKELSLSETTSVDKPEDIQTFTSTLPVVENLIIKSHCSFTLLCGLLWSCRPNFITLVDYKSGKTNCSSLEFVYEELKKQGNKSCLNSIHTLCIHGLESVDVEMYKESLRAWRPALQGAITDYCDGEQIRLKLKWLSAIQHDN